MTSEYQTSYVSPLPLNVSWNIAKQIAVDKLLLKIVPSFFASIEILEGGVGAGTVRLVTFGEGVGPQGAGQKVKERVDVVDDATHTISYSIVEGGDPRYQNVRFTLKFTSAGDSTKIDWIVKYTPVDASVPPPEHFKGVADVTNKAIDAYGKEHAAEFV